MTARGDDRKLMHWIASHGYTVVRASSGHWKIFDDGVLLTATSGTPSDWRSRYMYCCGVHLEGPYAGTKAEAWDKWCGMVEYLWERDGR